MRKPEKILSILLCALLILSIAACGEVKEEIEETLDKTNEDTTAETESEEQIQDETAPEEVTPEPEPEPEPDPTLLTVVLNTEKFMPDPAEKYTEPAQKYAAGMILDCMYKRALRYENGELVPGAVEKYEFTGGLRWALTVSELTDAEGNTAGAAALAEMLTGLEGVAAAELQADGTILLTLSDENVLIDELLRGVYLYAAADDGALPASTGKYRVESEGEDYIQLERVADENGNGADLIRFVFAPGATQSAYPEADVVLTNESTNIDAPFLPTDGTVVLVFNLNEKRLPAKRPDIRRAICAALDRNAIMLASGYAGEAASGIMPSATTDMPESVAYTQNLEQAEAYLTSGRYAEQNIRLLVTEDDLWLGEVIKQQLSAVGINIVLVTKEDVKNPATSEWDMAIIHMPLYSTAAEYYADALAADEEGTTWFNLSGSGVGNMAKALTTAGGRSEANLRLIQDWLDDNCVMTGLYTPGIRCEVSEWCGEYTVTDFGVDVTELKPRTE